jgi:hypothetical protein
MLTPAYINCLLCEEWVSAFKVLSGSFLQPDPETGKA